MTIEAPRIPQAFIWRRLHSLTGLWLVIYLIEHLLVNSQAALFIGDSGYGFIHAVNSIRDLPYLPIIELGLLGVPIFIHLVWGVKYVQTALYNSGSTNGSKPALPEYSRNQAYTWQRITAWLLVVLLLGHIIHMRFLQYPDDAVSTKDFKKHYFVYVNEDAGLYPVAARLGVDLYNQSLVDESKMVFENTKYPEMASPQNLIMQQKKDLDSEWVKKLQRKPLKTGEVIAVTPDYGTAELLMVRDTFQSPIMILLYTLFVLTAVYHAFNGVWTFMIKWGVTLTERSQRGMLTFAYALMGIVAFLGLASIWGTFWINLRQ